MKYPTLLILAIAVTGISTIVSAQGFHRYLPIGHAQVSSSEATPDGGLFAYFGQHPSKPLVKLNSAGELVWAKSTPGVSGMTSLPDGGLLLIQPTDGIQQPPGEESNTLLLQRLAPTGEMVMNRRIIIQDWWGDVYDWQLATALTPDDHLYLVTEANFNDKRLMKFNSEGELLWSKPLYASGYDECHIKVLPDGGVLFYSLDSSPGTMGNAVRLGPDGTVVWHRYLTISAPALHKNGSSILVDDSGNLLMAFTAISSTQPGPTPWIVLGMMDIDANMVWSYAYRREAGESMTNLQNLSYHQPSRILPNGNLYFGTMKGFEFTPQGIFVREQICTSPTLAPGFDEITHSFTTLPTADGWLQYGTRRWTDPVFGNFVQLPLLGRTTMELDSTCFWTCDERTDITPVPPPPEIFSPSALTSTSFLETFSTEDWPLETWADVTMDLLEDACQLPEIVEFNTSVPEQQGPVLLGLYPNPVIAGQVLQVDAEGPLVLELLDARGRMVARQLNGTSPALLNTVGLDAGLYLVRASRTTGQLVGTGRLVVQ